MKKLYLLLVLYFMITALNAQKKNPEEDLASLVNVFLGTSGDHGQLSPAASYPFSMLSIGPQTYPKLHAGYEYEAKRFEGFTHNRFEGVGCKGSGGNILIKPFLGDDYQKDLIKETQKASPGYYQVSFTNKIKAEFAVYEKSGMHHYNFPRGDKGFYIDLSHTLDNEFVAESHQITGNSISGFIEAKTTCNFGTYKIYYYAQFKDPIVWKEIGNHQIIAKLNTQTESTEIKIALSSTSINYAKQTIFPGTFNQIKSQAHQGWNQILSKIKVEGDEDRKKLFYSLLYRTVQSPYQISEKDGNYTSTNGEQKHSSEMLYNGWSIWDNYRTQLPLLSIAWPEKYAGITTSLVNLYKTGKKDLASQKEPTNTVRTEHSIVVLLDAYRKGFSIDFNLIKDSLINEVDHLDFSKPDKALESSYDIWALSEILMIIKEPELSEKYKIKAIKYKEYWKRDFKNIHEPDVDKVQARNLYQGTIWQYRWFVPFDLKGLIELTGNEESYLKQLNYFFDNDLYNHANEPDLQVPLMYNITQEPWKSQELIHRFAVDTVIQYYFNDNSKGIDPFIDKVYKNEPKAYIRTMDDDGGAMSAWFILASSGLSPACVGWPIYYLNVPLFKTFIFNFGNQKSLKISVENFEDKNKYIQKVTLNDKEIDRNYLTQQEIIKGGKLVITATDKPTKWGTKNQWVSSIK